MKKVSRKSLKESVTVAAPRAAGIAEDEPANCIPT